MRFTHVIHPFETKPGSEHDVAHRVTYASMRASVAQAARVGVPVEVLGAAFSDRPGPVESPVRLLPVVGRTAHDVRPMRPPMRLPLIADVFAVAAAHGAGEYVIYTNIDISLQPHFYVEVDAMLRVDGGPRALVINRRTISSLYSSPEQLSEMYRERGEAHPGYDCFVFPRSWIGRLDLGKSCIGTRHFDGLLIANLDLLSEGRFEIIRDAFLTFHIGDDRRWVGNLDYDDYNFDQAVLALSRIESSVAEDRPAHYRFLHAGYMLEARPHRRLMKRLKRFGPLMKLVRRWRASHTSRAGT